MADGSRPFDEFGSLRPGAVVDRSTWGLYMHQFHRSDDAGECHNHPFKFAISLILAGGYHEERRDRRGLVVTRTYRPGNLNFLWADSYHRVDLLEDDCWSLFLVGPKVQSWGFWNRHTRRETPWREFIAELRGQPS